jgi:hypothetical protein
MQQGGRGEDSNINEKPNKRFAEGLSQRSRPFTPRCEETMGRLYPDEKCIPVFSSNSCGMDKMRGRWVAVALACVMRLSKVLRIGEQTSAWCYARTHKGEKEIRNSKCEMRKGMRKCEFHALSGSRCWEIRQFRISISNFEFPSSLPLLSGAILPFQVERR